MSKFTETSVPVGAFSAQLTFSKASDVDCFTPDNADGRVFIVARNDNEVDASVVIRSGDGLLKQLGSVKLTVAANSEAIIPLSRLDSARVKFTKGENKGNILVNTYASGGSVDKVSYAIISIE